MPNQIAYGFYNLMDLKDRRVNEVGVDVVADAIDQSVAEHNRNLNAMRDVFAFATTDFKTVYRTPAGARLQPLDEDGRARKIKAAARFERGLPLYMAGVAWGANYVTREKMTVDEANIATTTLMDADTVWMRDHILAPIFDSAGYTFADPLRGDLSIKGLANSDTETYNVQAGADVGLTESHYLAQAAAIADGSNPFPVIYQEINEHPENSGKVVAFVPTNLKNSIMALSNFHEKQMGYTRPGANTEVLVQTDGLEGPGELIGEESGVFIREWRSLPDNYILAVSTGGPKPLAMRQEPESSLQGFKKVAERNDHPFYENQYLRVAGFGCWNRVAALVYRIGNASYAMPTSPIDYSAILRGA